MLGRTCPKCNRSLTALALRCECGYELPEARDLRSNPERPRCGLCDAPMELMAQTCPSCGAVGYPALRPRQGKKCQRAGDDAALAPRRD